MQFSLSFEVVGIISLFITFLMGYARLQYKVGDHDDKFKSIDAQHDKEITRLETAHATAIKAIHASHSERDKAIWEKINEFQNSMNTTLMEIAKQIGRVEGKIDKSE